MTAVTRGYNERLFTGGLLRRRLHLARFDWAKRVVASFNEPSLRLVEVGCFDGRLLEYMPVEVERYAGFDAGWEGGLEFGQRRFAGSRIHAFTQAVHPSALATLPDKSFNLAAALETLEHVPPELVDGYLSELARLVDGHLLVSVPNEKGAVFLAKYLVKKAVYGATKKYTPREMLAATLGRMHKVKRHEHKGFDYARMIEQVERHFDIVRVDSLPLGALPLSLSFTIGIVARSR